MQSFWHKLLKPLMVLAPMEDVTDAAFRALIARYGKPDVMFTEFTSADGLVLASPSAQRLLRKKFIYSEGERPIVAQIFSAVPAHIEKASALAAELGFDGVDINMGCPVAEVVKQNCGAALIKNPALARETIRAAKKCGLPISVKTRIGYDRDELDTWLPELLAEDLDAIIIHARTRKEMSDVPAHWDSIARAVQIRGSIQNPRGDASWMKTLIIGNGDVRDIAEARAKASEAKCDGVMLGRAIYGDPWLFAEANNPERGRRAITPQQKLTALQEHLQLFDELLSGTTNYATMKKHFKAYISGWDGAKEARIQLMATEGVAEAQALLKELHTTLSTSTL